MQEIERIILTILGILVSLENLVVVIAAMRNKSLLDNTHYFLVISLSVCDFILGLNVLTFGNVIMPNNDSDDENIHSLCAIINTVSCATYHMSLVQTFFISLNRYLVIIESKLNGLIWDGKRKYFLFCVMWIVTVVLNASILSSITQRCTLNSILGNTTYALMLNSIQSLVVSPTFILFFLTLWKIYKLHNKTDVVDDLQRNIRKRKRMMKSMKLVSLILITFVISIIPAVVIGSQGVSSRFDMFMLICFSASNSAVNPIIYCTQINDLKKGIKAIFGLNT